VTNFADHLAKFCGTPQQNCSNFAARRSFTFVNELSSILSRNFSYWRLALCSVMLARFKENYQSFFFSKVQSVKSDISDCVPYCNG